MAIFAHWVVPWCPDVGLRTVASKQVWSTARTRCASHARRRPFERPDTSLANMSSCDRQQRGFSAALMVTHCAHITCKGKGLTMMRRRKMSKPPITKRDRRQSGRALSACFPGVGEAPAAAETATRLPAMTRVLTRTVGAPTA